MVTAAFLWHSLVILLVTSEPTWIDDTFHQGLYENCPFTNFHDRASDVKVNATWRPCCSSCVSDPTCGKRAPCCPDYDVKPMTTTCTALMYALMPEDIQRELKVKISHYWMVDLCLLEHRESTLEKFCSVRDVVSVHNTKSLQPVLDTMNNIIYANRYCAKCNNVNTSNLANDMFTPVVKCFANTNAINVLTSFANIDEFLQAGLCYITFKLKSPDVVYPSICLPYDVISCNESKYWEEYNETIDIACQSYELAYTSGKTLLTYKNIHCYFCNTASRFISVEAECTDLFFAFPILKFSAILGSRDVYDNDDGNQDPDSSKYTGKGGCPATQFYDPYKGQCRDMVCPLTDAMTDSGCRRHLQYFEGVVWRIDVLWTIEGSDVLKLTGFKQTLATHAIQYIESRLIHPYGDILNLLELSVYVGMASNDSARVLISCRFLHDTDGATGPVMDFINGKIVGTPEEHHINESIVTIMTRCIRGDSISELDSEAVVYQISLSKFYMYRSIDRWGHMDTAVTLSKILSCDLVLLEESEYDETEDGLLVLNNSKVIMSEVDYFKDESGVRVCIRDFLPEESKQEHEGQSDQIKWMVSMVLNIVSILGLSVFLVTYLLFPSLRSPTGHLYTSICVSIIIFQTVQQFGVVRNNSVHTCKVIGVLVHFFALTTPLLMLGCSFHASRPLRTSKLYVTLCCSKRQLVPCCLVYTALVSGIIVALHILFSLLHTNMVDLGYGDVTCEIANISDRYYFLLMPVAIVLLANTVSLIVCLSTYSSVNNSEQSNDPMTKFYSKTLLVLSILAAAYWVCQGLFWWLEWEGLEYIYLVMNAARGICLVVAYFVNQPVLTLYGKLFSCEKPKEF